MFDRNSVQGNTLISPISLNSVEFWFAADRKFVIRFALKGCNLTLIVLLSDLVGLLSGSFIVRLLFVGKRFSLLALLQLCRNFYC